MILLKYKQILIIIFIFVFSLLYSLPNFYGEDPVVVVKNDFFKFNNISLDDVFSKLKINSSIIKSKKYDKNELIIRFFSTEDQFNFYTNFRNIFHSNSSISLNILNSTSNIIFEKIGAFPMKLGLDLRGGVCLLIKVNVKSNIDNLISSKMFSIKKDLFINKIFYKNILIENDFIKLFFLNNSDLQKFLKHSVLKYDDFDINVENLLVLFKINKDKKNEMIDNIINQSVQILSKRINELGVADSVILRQGKDKIVIEMPGIQDISRAKNILGKTAYLDFMIVDTENSIERALNGKVFKNSRIFYTKDGIPVLLKNKSVLSGDSIIYASSGFDQLKNMPCVNIKLGNKNIKYFEDMTKKNIGNLMAVLYKESFINDNGEINTKSTIISIAKIMSNLSKDFQITGLNFKEAKDLALLLRSGAMPTTLSIEEEKIVGPALGEKNISLGFKAVLFSFFVISCFMLFFYKKLGFISCIVLISNIFLLIAVMSLFGITLTLPGLAGISLTIGMSVDSNVLIFERIKEEYKIIFNFQLAVNNGFKNALTSIIDTNFTTLIIGLTLFLFGYGPLKGFAIALSLGILTSIYSSVFVTKYLLFLFFKSRY